MSGGRVVSLDTWETRKSLCLQVSWHTSLFSPQPLCTSYPVLRVSKCQPFKNASVICWMFPPTPPKPETFTSPYRYLGLLTFSISRLSPPECPDLSALSPLPALLENGLHAKRRFFWVPSWYPELRGFPPAGVLRTTPALKKLSGTVLPRSPWNTHREPEQTDFLTEPGLLPLPK